MQSNQEKTTKEDRNNKILTYKPSYIEIKKDKGKPNNDLKCKMCDYSCKKINSMRKHMNMKHVVQKCKICYKAFPNSIDALVHTAEYHSRKKKNPEDNLKIHVLI